MLVQCLEMAYRDSAVDFVSTFDYDTVEEIATEIERLCTLKVSNFFPPVFIHHKLIDALQLFAKDTSLADLSLQYRATAHLWVALHAHRRADPEQNTIMTQRSEEACR